MNSSPGQPDAVPASIRGINASELTIATFFTEQHLASRDIEDQTKVEYRQNRVFLWVAIKAILEEGFSAWAKTSEIETKDFVLQAGAVRSSAVKKLNRAVLAAYAKPLGLKAVARVTQLGINARRTLDFALEAILNSAKPTPTGGKRSPITLKLDWALGGLAEWPEVYSFGFEASMGGELARNLKFYTTEKNSRKDITAKQIANIFCTTESVIESLEAKALGAIRKSFKHSEALNEYSQDFLAND